jgi:DNA-binding GntR family transcriptional regulator
MAVGKHVGLATELEKDVLSGMYGWEGGLPSASELSQKWNMSLSTVKAALSLLEGKNLIEKRGVGYYVNRVSVIMTQHVPPIYIRLHRGGFYKNVGPVKRVSLPAHLAEKLQIAPQEAVYRVQISGEFIDGTEKPLKISYRYHLLPISDENIQRMNSDPNYDPMRDQAGELVSHDEATPRMATAGEQDLLQLPESAAVNYLFEVIRNKENKLLMAQEVILHPRETLIFDFPFTNEPS